MKPATIEIDRDEDDEAINFAKMAADLDTNPKVRRAGRNGREVYLFVLRRVAVLRTQGRIPVSNVDTWYLHDQLMMSEAEAEAGLAACLAPYKDEEPLLEIAGGKVVVCGWSSEWGRRPLSASERKRRQRERERSDGASGHDESRSHEPSRDVTVVTPSHACHGSDQRRGDDQERGPDIPVVGSDPPISGASGSGDAGARDPSTHYGVLGAHPTSAADRSWTEERSRLMRLLGPLHVEAFNRVRADLNSPVPAMQHGGPQERALRELLIQQATLEGFEERARHVLEVREAEARRITSVKFLGASVWGEASFSRAITMLVGEDRKDAKPSSVEVSQRIRDRIARDEAAGVDTEGGW